MSSSPNAPQSILITGATGGIGGALACAYATAGVQLFLQGRNGAKLAEVAARCTALGATVETAAIDVRERAQLVAWLQGVGARVPLDLVVICAGININIGADGAGERWADTEALIDINITAAIATVDAVLPAMRARRQGQIALFSSLAAYFGLPITPSYCASKAAIKAYGEALRGWLAPEGIRINVVMPGFVESPMCEEFPGPKPFLWPADKAARYIQRGLAANRARISFPFPLNLGSWYLGVAPAALAQKLVSWFNFSKHRG